jgi:hypothetical protein
MSKQVTKLDIQGMYDRFKVKHDQYIEERMNRAAFQMIVMMNWCKEQGAKSNE